MRHPAWLVRFPLVALALTAACAAESEDEATVDDSAVADTPADNAADSPNAQVEAEAAAPLSEVTLKIPMVFRTERPDCESLKAAKAPPPDLKIRDLVACLSDDSRQALATRYARKAARVGAIAPPDFNAFLTAHGDKLVATTRIRDLAFGGARPRDVRVAGVEPGPAPRALVGSSSTWGLDPTTCGKSCLSVSVPVVGGSRKIGVGPAWTSATPSPGDGRRLLDNVYPGKFPDYNQDDLRDEELQGSGCGPTSAVNLFEWWSIPVYKGSTHLTSYDDRAEYIADRMDTLDGINFTDDEELIDFVTKYPKEMYNAGRISGYPGYHYMVDDPAGWKVMLSYISRGYPVIVLYASGETGMHWALITGYSNGKLRIANAQDRTLADFYAQWHDWADLAWYAEWAVDLYVDTDTFVALTGWGNDGTPTPERMSSRVPGSAPPGYTAGGSTYGWRYCTSAPDDIGFGSEMLQVPFWSGEPVAFLPGYCMFTSKRTSLAISGGGSASSKKGSSLTVTVPSSASLSSFVSANPGVRCEFNGYSAATGWKALASKKCSETGALSYKYTNQGTYTKLEFHVHSPDLARVTWNVTTTN